MKKLWLRFLILINILLICCALFVDIIANDAKITIILVGICSLAGIIECAYECFNTLYCIIHKTCKDGKKRNKEQTKPKEITAEIGFTSVDGDFVHTFKGSTSAEALASAKDFANEHHLKIISIKCY